MVVLVSALAAGFLQLSSQLVNNRKASRDKRAAFYMAEAGLAEAYVGLTIGKTGNVGLPTAPATFGNGLFWVEATPLEGDLVRLESHGRVRTGNAVLSLVAEKGERSVASLGVFSGKKLDVPPGSVLDGWDSESGGYPTQAAVGLNDGGRLGSNSDVTISGTAKLPTKILGDVASGPGATVTMTGEVDFSGESGPSRAAQSLPPITVPAIEPGKPLDHSAVEPLVLPAGNWNFSEMAVRPGADLVLQGPATIVTQSLQVEGNAQLTFDTTGGEISLMATSGLEFAAGSLVSTTDVQPDQVVIQVTGPTASPVLLQGKSQFFGVVYAPQADIQVASSFEVFGALVGAGLQFSGPVRLHFDRHLDELALEAVLPTLMSWRIVELDAEPRGLNDPFQVLGVDPALCPPAAEAHADQVLHITYTDLGGSTRTYDGQETDFDWGNVLQVDELSRDGEVVVATASDARKAATTSTLAVAMGLPEPVTDADLASALIAASPLLDKYVYYAIDDPILSSSSLHDVLVFNSPLVDGLVQRTVESSDPMDAPDLTDVLIANAPLTDVELQSVLKLATPLPSNDLANVLVNSSPLPAAVWSEVSSGTYLSAGDLALVAGYQ